MTGFNKNEIMKVLDGLSYEEKLLKIEEYVDICVAQNTIPIINEYVYTHSNYFDQDLINLYENYLNGLRDKNYYKIYDNLKHLNILLYEYLSKNGLFDEELNKRNEELQRERDSINNNIVVMSFMIFRTGTILIVGMCEENVIQNIYERIKEILTEEYHTISLSDIDDTILKPVKIKKSRKRTITITNN